MFICFHKFIIYVNKYINLNTIIGRMKTNNHLSGNLETADDHDYEAAAGLLFSVCQLHS